MSSEIQPTPLADRILRSTQNGEDVSAFHTEINSLTNQERLQLVRDLGRGTSANNTSNPQRRFYADGQVERSTGELVDIDIVEVTEQNGQRTARRHDLYTPGARGEQVDRRQDIQAYVAPYEVLYSRMMLDSESRGQQDRRSIEAYDRVRVLLANDSADDPDKNERLRMLKERTIRPDVALYEPVLPVDSYMASRPNTMAPDGIRRALEEQQRNWRKR